MGIFDRFTGRKPVPPPREDNAAPAAEEPKSAAAGGVLPQLAEARAKLAANDVAAAMTIYEEILAAAGDRPDVLLTASADLGTHGRIAELIELIAPRYDFERHGAGPGLNLLQAYLAARQPEAAQHLLDLLFSHARPELHERLMGFSRAIGEMGDAEHAAEGAGAEATTVSLVSISKPIWFYGLEECASSLLPTSSGPRRRVAFAQCALLGESGLAEQAAQPEDATGRFSRGLPLWFAETFFFSAGYEPLAGIGVFAPRHYALFPMEWTAENIRQLAESTSGGLDYVVTSSLRNRHGDHELTLRIWEMKKFRELKNFSARWTPADADAVLARFHEQFRAYMEWTALPAGSGLAYAPPVAPLAHIQALGASLGLFLVEKEMLPAAHAPVTTELFLQNARANPGDARAQAALITALLRLRARGVEPEESARQHVREWLASESARAAGLAALSEKFA